MPDLTQHPVSARPDRARLPDRVPRSGLRPGPGPQPAPAPLAVTSDPALADALLRVAAEAGVRIDIVPGPSAARRRWAAAPLVLIGVDQTGEVARAGLPHRPEVAVI